jgi:hypothetical protein
MSDIETVLKEILKPIEEWSIHDDHYFDGPNLTVHLDIPNAFMVYQVDFLVNEDDVEITFTQFNHENRGFDSDVDGDTWITELYPLGDPRLFEKITMKVREVCINLIESFKKDHDASVEACKDALKELRTIEKQK